MNSSVAFIGTAPGTGAGNGESTCVDGANCDVFTLTVNGQPADYVNSVVSVTLDWTVPANDYDLVIHKGTVTGPIVSSSGSGPPSTHEAAGIRPSSTGTGVYVVHVVYFATIPNADQYKGLAKTVARPPERAVTYRKGGGIRFSPNFTVKAPNTVRDGEPSSRTDFKGNHYIGGIRGVPAGVDLWYFNLNPSSPTYDPLMTNPIYRGQPDSFTGKDPNAVGADGGGDIDLAVGFGIMPEFPEPSLAFSSLVAANISVGNSYDKGATFSLNPAGNGTGGAPVDDREWQEFYGGNFVYLLYRTVDPVVAFVQRSNDSGFTYRPAVVVGPSAQTGDIDVSQKDGTVYAFFNDGRVAVGVPPTLIDEPTSYTFHQAASDPFGVSHIFCMGKVAEDGTPNGTLYVAYSNDQDVFMAYSKDKGTTWSLPARVSDVPGGTNVFPWMETGPTPGSVVIAWYGSPNQPFNNDDANWKVYFAQSFNADTAVPTFTQVEASDHFIHGSNISEGGLTGAANRNLIDYFQITIDPAGAAVIGFTDDHNDTDGATYVTRQIAGPSIKGGNISLPSPIPAPAPRVGEEAPPAQPGPNGEQVTDFAQDARDAAPARVVANSPSDILSIKYGNIQNSGNLLLTATMKVSSLPAIPANATYRMTFTANAPDTVLSATGDYTYGLSDRGDQFFFAVTTTAANTPTYRYGTAVRGSNGSLTYTNQGIADSGSFDTTNGTLTVNVALAKFNALLATAGHPVLQIGSRLAGLRGTASAGLTDSTRGGTFFTVGGADSVVSRKTHGSAGDFDIDLPITGTRGIECRNGGASGNFTLIYSFANTVTSVASVSVSAPNGSPSASGSPGPNANQYTVNLTGVTNAQYVTVTLNNVQTSGGISLAAVSTQMGVLNGDTNGDGAVNSGDTQQTRDRSGQLVDTTNFRSDVNLDGVINSADATVARNRAGTALTSLQPAPGGRSASSGD
ncbi:MAG: dockerin type I repeat-containing protein [Verrucomicrobiota bacterium]|nr:dockerin type I repeat-containing protein [Verrucomicrobiota bacterium]